MSLLVDCATVDPEIAMSPADFGKLNRCPLCGADLLFSYGLMGGGLGAYALCRRDDCPFTAKETPMTDENENETTGSSFSDADQESIVDAIADDDLRARSQQLHEAQETWEELAYLHNPKMPCPECSGAGQVPGGSLGDICLRCLGTRVVEQPGSQPLEMPPFAQLRASISAYGDAAADRALPAGHRGKRHLALPAPATVPTLEQIQKLKTDALEQVRQLVGAAPGIVDQKKLAKPRKAKGLAGDGGLGDFEEAELADMEEDV